MPESVAASIDVGSTSVHLLVATVDDHRLTPLIDESVFLGLGAAVVERHHLGLAARAGLVDALGTYRATASSLDAAAITVIGTEPIRGAGDGLTVVHEVEQGTGLALHVLTHGEEALLTVVGVMAGRPVAHETLVIDIGGGSSEFCLVGPDRRAVASGLRLGSDRLTRRFAQHDPPTSGELDGMREEARAIVDELPSIERAEIVAVGGTVSNLVKVIRNGASEGPLTRDETARALELLTAEPAEAAASRYGVKPIRARILPAGAAIVDAILRRFRADTLRVSDAGIREGAILAAAHAGHAWRDRLPELARGWRT